MGTPQAQMKRMYTKVYRWLGFGEDGFTCLNAVEATGTETEVDVSQWRHVGITIIGHDDAGAGAANLTVKCKGSYLSPANIDFDVAASITNPWDFVSLIDLQDISTVNGDTGVAFAAANDVRQFELNANCMRTLTFDVTAYVDGACTVIIYPVNNQ